MVEWRTIWIFMDVFYTEVPDYVIDRRQTDDTPDNPIFSLANIFSLFVVENHLSVYG